MSKTNKTLLEDLFFNGFATKDISLLDGKINVVIRSLAAKDQLVIEQGLSTLKGSTAYVLHTYSLNLLSHTIIKYGKEEFKDSVEALKYIETLPGAVIDYLVKAQTGFEKEIAKLYTGEEIDAAFFETASTERDLKQSQQDSTLDPATASAS